MIKEMDIRKPVKSLIVRNLLYEIGLKDTIVLKISQEETENLFLTKLLNHKLKPNSFDS
jgi:hypothetical protein